MHPAEKNFHHSVTSGLLLRHRVGSFPITISPTSSFYMKHLFFSLSLLFFGLAVFSQDIIRDKNVEDRGLSGFRGVDVSAGIKLYLSEGVDAVAVSANSIEARNRITTRVVDGILKISYDTQAGRSLRGDKNLIAYVSISELKHLVAQAGAIVSTRSPLKTTELSVKATSGAIIKGAFSATGKMIIDQNSGSIVTINGEVAHLQVKGSSGSVFNGFDLRAKHCDAATNSGGSVQVNVLEELSVNASSGGSIQYKGGAVIRNVRTNSGGSVSKKG